jgi:hypothetical protein
MPRQAGPKIDDTIDKLKQAQKKLEELFKSIREQEVERILAALKARCEKMLAMAAVCDPAARPPAFVRPLLIATVQPRSIAYFRYDRDGRASVGALFQLLSRIGR